MCIKNWEDARRRGQQMEVGWINDFVSIEIFDTPIDSTNNTM